MKKKKKNLSMEFDELGLVSFKCNCELDFVGCLKKYIDSVEKMGIKNFSKNYLSSHFKDDIRFATFVEYIYSNLSDKASIDFFNEYGNDFSMSFKEIGDLINHDLSKRMIIDVKNVFLTDLSDYYKFLDDVSKECVGLKSKYIFYKQKEEKRLERLKNNYSGDKKDFGKYVNSDLEYINSFVTALNIQDRQYSLGEELCELRRNINEYLYFDDSIDEHNTILSIIDEFAEGKAQQLVQSQRKSYKFNILDYKKLIDLLKTKSRLVPATLMVVISDIERIAKKNGIVLDISAFEILGDSISSIFDDYDNDYKKLKVSNDFVKRYI